MARRLHSITVRELREMLDEYKGTAADDLPAVICYNYGDYHNTAAIDVIDEVKPGKLEESAYSASGFAVAETEEGIDDDDIVEMLEEDEIPAIILGRHFEGGR